MYYQISVNVPQVSGVFDYHAPEELAAQLQPGCLVVVPFGKQRVQGVVIRTSQTPQVLDTRPVEALLDPLPVVTPTQLRLAEWLSAQTLATLAACVDLMLPPGLSQQADTLYSLNPAAVVSGALNPGQRRLLTLLEERGGLRGRQIEAAFPRQDWKAILRSLTARGWLDSRPVLPPPGVRPKLVRAARLALPPAGLTGLSAETLGRGAAGERRLAVLRFLAQEALPVQVSWIYAASGANAADLQKLAEDGFIQLYETEIWRDPLEKVDFLPQQPPALTDPQQAAWEQLQAGIGRAAQGEVLPPYLLNGVTGSGKTELYLQAVQQTLARGRQALILVPEIALTPQTVRRFLARFPGQVGLIHSRLSPGERYDTWRRARAGQLPVIVGPRSALFTPLPDVGLIVLDECHDASYYQTEHDPQYSALTAAHELARLAHAVLIFGSATPGIRLTYRARREGWPVLDLPWRVLAHRQVVEQQLAAAGISLPPLPSGGPEAASLPLPPVEVVDMRAELKAGNRSIFSRALQTALRETVAAGRQAILFLNRRGTATYVFCRECGFTIKCPRCDLPLTYHAQGDQLRCHTCGYQRELPRRCPQCGGSQFRQLGTGTERVEAAAHELLPQATILRYDAETTRQKDAHEMILSHFANHRADVLVGTQMLAKGLDLPLVTLVGVVLADSGLNFPDYGAAERTFQLLTQVAGRAGRSPLGGKAIFQTFQPEHYVIQAAARHDYEGFYARELEYRRQLKYPPFYRLARLEYRAADPGEAEAEAVRLGQQVSHWIESGGFNATEMIGPAPCFFAKVNSQYRWQIVLRSPDPAALLRSRPLPGWRVEMDPVDLL